MSEQLEKELYTLKLEYIQSLGEKSKELAKALMPFYQALRANQVPPIGEPGQPQPPWKELIFHTHKLAGASGTYGLKTLSAVAAFIEDHILDGKLPTLPATPLLSLLDQWKRFYIALVKNYRKGAQISNGDPQILKDLDQKMLKHWEQLEAQWNTTLAPTPIPTPTPAPPSNSTPEAA